MPKKAIIQFMEELQNVITRYQQEADLTFAETIGVIEIVKLEMANDLFSEMEIHEDDSDDEGGEDGEEFEGIIE